MSYRNDLGILLRLLFERSGLTTEELCAALGPGFTPSTIACYARGTVIPNAKNTRRIAEFFGSDAARLVALRDKAAAMRYTPFTGCDIPTRCHPGRQVPSDAEYWTGTMFCANACPDVARIPAQCPATCEPGERDMHDCPLAPSCPCGRPPTEERERAFRTWLAERKRRIRAALRQDAAIAERRAFWRELEGSDGNTPDHLW